MADAMVNGGGAATNVIGIARSLGATFPQVAMCAHCFAVRVDDAGRLCRSCVEVKANEARMRAEALEMRRIAAYAGGAISIAVLLLWFIAR